MADREIQNLHALKVNGLWIKIKAQNFASQVLSKHTFKIWRKKASVFFDHRGTLNLRAHSLKKAKFHLNRKEEEAVLLTIKITHIQAKSSSKRGLIWMNKKRELIPFWKVQPFQRNKAMLAF